MKAVSDSRLIAMVNLTYRNVPALQNALELVTSGAIGEVRHNLQRILDKASEAEVVPAGKTVVVDA
jgi:hypothetical protein